MGLPSPSDTLIVDTTSTTVPHISPPFVSLGEIHWNGGSLSGHLAVGLGGALNWTRGMLSSTGALTVLPGGSFSLDGAGYKEISGVLTNRGSVQWLDGWIGFYHSQSDANYQGEIWNESGGTIDIQCDQLASDQGWKSPLHNAGLVVKSGQNGATDVRLRPDNTGTIEARTGLIQFAANVPHTVSGSLAVALGGTEPGSGCPRIHYAGTVALGGTFSVRTRDGFRPSPGDVFEVLTFDAATGSFECIAGLDLGNGLHLVPQFSRDGLRLVAETYEEGGDLPRLFIVPVPGGVRVSWPPSFSGWELISALDLPAAEWELVPTACENQVFVPFTLPRQFFQLRQIQ